ncbi:extracellular solute-binding protein [Paramaledivibacter caminithermalis]|uniref:Putative aldouronate transport system substrate-binding protein n=1 Tax=Paramaledivibacter caminithermalis (strain DSM 15212 / CIP 107654 / DViRD3) TaxID=1121301 RepID=A0A1M6RX34_PARC5|nr:extracellular solute-binding protein [Paramaledivibacter caminithermalis]SHK37115.1 putative aldouronate transport system substrate-binding protein [Paramaledivibacter caminithermalis DSM 15212]
MKKILALLLIITLMFSLIGCGKAKQEDASSASGNTSNTENSSENNNETKDGEPVKLRIVMKDLSPSNPGDVKYIEELEKALAKKDINVKFEIVETPSGNYAEKLNLLLLGEDIPDIIYFQGGDKQIAEQGILEDLTPYIEKSEIIQKAMLPHNKKRMENYPYLIWLKPIKTKAPVVRSDWFEASKTGKALLDNPTIDNYYKFLKELKEKDFSGDGMPKYGLTVSGNIIELDSIFNQAFGITGAWVKDSEGKYVYGKVSEFEKEKLAFYHKLYKEGILDPEYLTKKWDTKEKAFYDNTVGLIIGSTGKVIDIYDGKMKKANGQEASLTVLPPAKGKGQGYLPIDVTKESRGIAISALSPNKELAFKVIEFLASDEGQMLDRLGFEGEHYEVKDGKIHLTEKSQEWFAKFFEVHSWEPTKKIATPLLSEPAVDSMKKAEKYYVEDTNFMIPEGFVASWDAMTNLYKEYSADIITGKKSIEEFDTFVKQWYEAGGKEITEFANKLLK